MTPRAENAVGPVTQIGRSRTRLLLPGLGLDSGHQGPDRPHRAQHGVEDDGRSPEGGGSSAVVASQDGACRGQHLRNLHGRTLSQTFLNNQARKTLIRWLGNDMRTMLGSLVWWGRSDQAHMTQLARTLGYI